MAGRVISIDVEKWTHDNLRKVIVKGSTLLNFEFDENLIDSIIEESFDNVYIVQEICYRICLAYKINQTLSSTFFIGTGMFESPSGNISYSESIRISDVVKEIINRHNGRYHSFILQFSDGFQNSDMETYKWLLYPILHVESDELIEGLTFNRIKELIKEKHSRGKDLNQNNLLNALKSLTNLQLEKSIIPNILDFDQTNLRLNVVDKEFIVWLRYQQKETLYNMASLNHD